ncbi:MAG: phage tail sheath subtilisin-like domain-containing protein [Xanthomonadaceae bacterium]|nr:phage tail sheath subtilisin-like domain-containing protein [Xanthomonadaceae bacterium]
MSDKFLHGAEVIEIDAGPRPIQTVRSSVIGIIGTAPNAQAEVKARLLTGVVANNNALTFTSKLLGALGNQITVNLRAPVGNNLPLAITVAGQAITVDLATGAGGAVSTTATQLTTAIAGHAAANALIGVTNTGTSTGVGIVAATPGAQFLAGGIDEAFPLNTPVLIAGSRAEAAKLGTAGTLPDAIESIFDQAGAVVVVVRVADGGTEPLTTANVIGGTNATTGQFEGVHAFRAAESVVGFSPRILIAPGFTHQRAGSANAVVAELIGIAERLRAVIIADGPNSTDAAAITYAGDFGSSRVFVVDPWVTKLDANGQPVNVPVSPHVAGVIAKSDNDRGFWWSPSNTTINGIIGTARGVDMVLGDAHSRANLLNERKVATIIRQEGFRLWGNRSLASDPKWAFLSVRRTADIINDSILRAHLWAVDRNITKTYLEDVTESVNAYLRDLTSLGAILGGRCWADPDLNTPAQIAQGNVFFNFSFTPPYPAEHITFRSHLVNDYLTELLD